ncbi:AbrB/MazE/SpoVT family DNA-binding domain-containing protein [Marinobacterium sp. D7]|uniref:AbrB/MazE/SpoVT family DNA-binding domain-containing protein n=1 Tax=Marinobacterium ramblicola TaxID=2849041 RepID=UPI001C2DDFB9|nr:AbrB/MazE/SpoVT family DNA-binding domain-containing protein [Marinobacterium ramblicola]MBV1790677.1 AbrB/MazE/SpoVT family DNA-binding domain-containing protein [Marinobacterium ramblicola]
MQTSIRKWGNSSGAIIPAAVLAKAGFSQGDTVEIEAVDGQIVIKPALPTYNLEDLLKASPSEAMALDDEDRAWLHEAPVGKEI